MSFVNLTYCLPWQPVESHGAVIHFSQIGKSDCSVVALKIPTNLKIIMTNVGMKNMRIPPATLHMRLVALFLISSGLLETAALPKSISPKAMMTSGITILKIVSAHPTTCKIS